MTGPALGAERFLAGLANRRPPLPLLFVGLFSLLMFLPGFFALPPVDRDETRFAQAARQMVETGEYVDIRLGDATRYKKPAGIYWLQAAALNLAGTAHAREIWVYRLPSLAGAVAACLLTYLIALVLVNAEAALLAAALMAVCLTLNGEARLAKTDAALLASILGAQLALARLHMHAALPRFLPWVFWVSLAASVLIKGPVGPMVAGLTILVLIAARREVRWLAPLRFGPGLLLFAVLVAPWFVAITLKAGHAFWDEALGRDLLGKIGTGQESHGAPPGAYAVAVWITFWPASILLPFGLRLAWTGRREPAVLFCLSWLVPSWLVFEASATKLIHYVLPTYPALAILCAAGWLRREGGPGRRFSVFLIAALALAPALGAAPAILARNLGTWPAWPWYAGLAVSLAGIWWVWTTMRAGGRLSPLPGLAALSLGLSLALFSNLARTGPLWPSNALAGIRDRAALCDDPLIVSLGYQEESLRLLLPEPPVFAHDAARAAEEARAAPCALVFATAPYRAAFEAALTGRSFRIAGQVRGFSIGGAEDVEMTAYLVR